MKPSPKRPAAPKTPAAEPATPIARPRRQAPDKPVEAALPPRVRRLMTSPTWRPADHDVDFLQQPDMRGIRLQLEYEKTERALQAAGIDHTVVVYGGSRTLALAQARKRLAEARRAFAARPGDRARQAAVGPRPAGRLFAPGDQRPGLTAAGSRAQAPRRELLTRGIQRRSCRWWPPAGG